METYTGSQQVAGLMSVAEVMALIGDEPQALAWLSQVFRGCAEYERQVPEPSTVDGWNAWLAFMDEAAVTSDSDEVWLEDFARQQNDCARPDYTVTAFQTYLTGLTGMNLRADVLLARVMRKVRASGTAQAWLHTYCLDNASTDPDDTDADTEPTTSTGTGTGGGGGNAGGGGWSADRERELEGFLRAVAGGFHPATWKSLQAYLGVDSGGAADWWHAAVASSPRMQALLSEAAGGPASDSWDEMVAFVCAEAAPHMAGGQDTWGQDDADRLHRFIAAVEQGSVPRTAQGLQRFLQSWGASEQAANVWTVKLLQKWPAVFTLPGSTSSGSSDPGSSDSESSGGAGGQGTLSKDDAAWLEDFLQEVRGGAAWSFDEAGLQQFAEDEGAEPGAAAAWAARVSPHLRGAPVSGGSNAARPDAWSTADQNCLDAFAAVCRAEGRRAPAIDHLQEFLRVNKPGVQALSWLKQAAAHHRATTVPTTWLRTYCTTTAGTGTGGGGGGGGEESGGGWSWSSADKQLLIDYLHGAGLGLYEADLDGLQGYLDNDTPYHPPHTLPATVWLAGARTHSNYVAQLHTAAATADVPRPGDQDTEEVWLVYLTRAQHFLSEGAWSADDERVLAGFLTQAAAGPAPATLNTLGSYLTAHHPHRPAKAAEWIHRARRHSDHVRDILTQHPDNAPSPSASAAAWLTYLTHPGQAWDDADEHAFTSFLDAVGADDDLGLGLYHAPGLDDLAAHLTAQRPAPDGQPPDPRRFIHHARYHSPHAAHLTTTHRANAPTTSKATDWLTFYCNPTKPPTTPQPTHPADRPGKRRRQHTDDTRPTKKPKKMGPTVEPAVGTIDLTKLPAPATYESWLLSALFSDHNTTRIGARRPEGFGDRCSYATIETNVATLGRTLGLENPIYGGVRARLTAPDSGVTDPGDYTATADLEQALTEVTAESIEGILNSAKCADQAEYWRWLISAARHPTQPLPRIIGGNRPTRFHGKCAVDAIYEGFAALGAAVGLGRAPKAIVKKLRELQSHDNGSYNPNEYPAGAPRGRRLSYGSGAVGPDPDRLNTLLGTLNDKEKFYLSAALSDDNLQQIANRCREHLGIKSRPSMVSRALVALGKKLELKAEAEGKKLTAGAVREWLQTHNVPDPGLYHTPQQDLDQALTGPDTIIHNANTLTDTRDRWLLSALLSNDDLGTIGDAAPDGYLEQGSIRTDITTLGLKLGLKETAPETIRDILRSLQTRQQNPLINPGLYTRSAPRPTVTATESRPPRGYETLKSNFRSRIDLYMKVGGLSRPKVSRRANLSEERTRALFKTAWAGKDEIDALINAVTEGNEYQRNELRRLYAAVSGRLDTWGPDPDQPPNG